MRAQRSLRIGVELDSCHADDVAPDKADEDLSIALLKLENSVLVADVRERLRLPLDY